MKLLFTSRPLLSLSTIVHARTNPFKKRSVDLSVGWQNFAFLDKRAFLLAYSTNSIFPNIGVLFSWQTANSRYELGLSGTIGNLTPPGLDKEHTAPNSAKQIHSGTM